MIPLSLIVKSGGENIIKKNNLWVLGKRLRGKRSDFFHLVTI